MTPLDNILQRIAAREAGRGRWRAKCPSHDGVSSSSLSIGEGDDGRVLLKCWAGCGIDQIVGAMGLELDALFPPRPAEPGAGTKPQRLRLPAWQALQILVNESMVIAVVGGDMARRKSINDVDHQRLVIAVGRVNRIAEATK